MSSHSSTLRSPHNAASQSVPIGRGQFFLELFAGTGNLSKAVARQGIPVLEPVEIADDPAFDLRRRETQQLVLRWIRSGTIGFIHLGTPCTIWSRARHGVSNSAKNLAKEAVGLELALFSCEVIVKYSLENPASSRLFSFEPLIRALRTGDLYHVSFDMCSYGEPFKKETKIVTSCQELQRLEKHCQHRRHSVWLKGQIKVKEQGREKFRNRTTLAGAYPTSLCESFAHALVESRSCAAHGETDCIIQNHWTTAIRCYTPKRLKCKPAKANKTKSTGGCETNTLEDCNLLEKAGGLTKYFDFIALGRQHKEAWDYLKKTEAKRRRQVAAVRRHHQEMSSRETLES